MSLWHKFRLAGRLTRRRVRAAMFGDAMRVQDAERRPFGRRRIQFVYQRKVVQRKETDYGIQLRDRKSVV